MKFLPEYKCDSSMRRSKERCFIAANKRWKCTGECRACICCLVSKEDGTQEHFNPLSKKKV